MNPLTLFNQNFSTAEKLLQMYLSAGGLKRTEFPESFRNAVCAVWGVKDNTHIRYASNDRMIILTRSASGIPELIMEEGGMDFLLRQAVMVACTALESFLWDMVRKNAPTIVRAHRTKADHELRNLTLTLEQYLSMERVGDLNLRLQKVILQNFERKILHDMGSIDRIANILTVRNFWEEIEKTCGGTAADIKRLVGELIARRNQIAHRADRPDDQEETDRHGLKPITFSWTNMRVQAVKTFVLAAAEVFSMTLRRLEQKIHCGYKDIKIAKYSSLRQLSR